MTVTDNAALLQPRPSSLDRASFVATFGGIYEHSPWVAEGAFEVGIMPQQDTAAGLHAVLAAIVDGAGREAQLDLLRAHPDLAGRLAVAGDLTPDSTAEQAGAGLDSCTPEEFARFQDLNGRYRERFGFPFILAVRGKGRTEILEAFEERVNNAPDVEFATALEQVHRIALLRLQSLQES